MTQLDIPRLHSFSCTATMTTMIHNTAMYNKSTTWLTLYSVVVLILANLMQVDKMRADLFVRRGLQQRISI